MGIIRALVAVIIILQNYSFPLSFAQQSMPKQLTNEPSKGYNKECSELPAKSILTGGWHSYNPYQFNYAASESNMLAGVDIKLVNEIAKIVGVQITYSEVPWQQHVLDVKNGTRDIASGVTYSPDRAEFGYFSVPYRFEENSLFVLKDLGITPDFKTIEEFLAQIRRQNFRLGVVAEFVYGDANLNHFINNQENGDIVLKYEDQEQALQALLKGEIEGFINDSMVGNMMILHQALDKIKEIPLNLKTPIHLLFSKKTVALDLVVHFNQVIQQFVSSAEYKTIVNYYLSHMLLLQIINSALFYYIGVIGVIAFAVGAVAIAMKENTTLFIAILFAIFPSIGGSIMRDIILDSDAPGINFDSSYLFYTLATVIIGFIIIRLLHYYNQHASQDNFLCKFLEHVFIISEALGQSAFIVTGVAAAILAKIEPIEIWGPFFVFLTSHAGCIIRDILRKGAVIDLLEKTNIELSIAWALAFSVYLSFNSYSQDAVIIKKSMVLTFLGAFLTRLIFSYLKVPKLRFVPNVPENTTCS